jgi:hypothetical protein
MGLFNRKNKDEQPRTCPECCQIVTADATTCDLCGAELTTAPTANADTVMAGTERTQ